MQRHPSWDTQLLLLWVLRVVFHPKIGQRVIINQLHPLDH